MDSISTTRFSLGPVLVCGGMLCLTIAAYIAARHFKSYLLYIGALGFLVCLFSNIMFIAMPIQLTGDVWPPYWVSWLALVGSPVALLGAGAATLTFVVLRGRMRT